MTYRSVLVHLDQDRLCEMRIKVAMRLSRAVDCHLVGLAPTGLVVVPAFGEGVETLAGFSDRAWETLRDQAQRATQQFSDACRAQGIKSFELVVDEADKAGSLVRHAHCSDLTLLSQADPSAPGHQQAQNLVEQVVLRSARPTLIVPYAGRFDQIGTNVMVAWDDGRESARALSDALPLLRLAERVQVVTWNEEGVDALQHLRPRLEALRRWLGWQGVVAEIAVESTQIGIADAMLSRAADLNADMIVMGAYGHARWSERMLGGATRGLLETMTVPVVMSH